MKHTAPFVVRVLGAVWATALACDGSGGQVSSESHWIRCVEDSECMPHDVAAACVQGYCQGADGERLVVAPQASGGAASAGSGSTATSGGGAATSNGGSDPANGGASSGGSAAGGSNGGAGGAAAGGSPQVGGGAAGCSQIPGPAPAVDTFEGDYLITDAASITAAQRYVGIGGSLTISSRGVDGIDDIRLPALERLGGDLVIRSTTVVRVNLQRLERIGGNVDVALNPDLLELDLRQLEAVVGSVTVTDNTSLQRLRLDTLTSVASFDADGPEMASCEIGDVLQRIGVDGPPGGRADCACVERCGWLEVDCP